MEQAKEKKKLAADGKLDLAVSQIQGLIRPFLQLEIVLENNEGVHKVVPARIQPGEIDYYYPGFYEGTVIVTKSRSSYLATLPVEELDNALQAYYSAVQNNAGQFGVLKITPKPKLHATS